MSCNLEDVPVYASWVRWQDDSRRYDFRCPDCKMTVWSIRVPRFPLEPVIERAGAFCSWKLPCGHVVSCPR